MISFDSSRRFGGALGATNPCDVMSWSTMISIGVLVA
jgi:hypothetical protein